MILDLIADVTDYKPMLTIKSQIRQSLNILKGQNLYPYVDVQNKLLYLFVYELQREQHLMSFEFTDINLFIDFSNELAKKEINIIASKHIAISDVNEVSLIYDIPSTNAELIGQKFPDYIKNLLHDKYNKIILGNTIWHGNEENQNIYTKLIYSKHRNVGIEKKKVSANFTISFADEDLKNIGFIDPQKIKKCVQIAYPGILAIVFRFYDDDKIKKVNLSYENSDGSYAKMLKVLKNLYQLTF